MERWRTNLYTLWVTQVFSLMGFGLCMPFVPFYFQDLGIIDTIELNYYVGLSSTLPAATMAVAAPLWGMASDRYGRKVMIMRAMFFASILLPLMGYASSAFQFLVLRSLQGIFTGTVTASMSFVSANTPENRMSYALGMMTSSNFLGLSVGPFLGGLLADSVSYRSCFFLGGLLMAIGLVLVIFLVKENPNTYGFNLRSNKQEDKGHSVFTPFILLVMTAVLIQRISRTIFMPFLPLYVQGVMGNVSGISTVTGLINGATSLATAVSALTITRLGDKKDKLSMSFILICLALPVTILIISFRSLIIFTLLYTVFFFLAGAIEPIVTSAASERIPASRRGALFGMFGTVGSIGTMVSPMVGSYLSSEFQIRAILYIIPILTTIQIFILYKSKKKGKVFSEEDREGE